MRRHQVAASSTAISSGGRSVLKARALSKRTGGTGLQPWLLLFGLALVTRAVYLFIYHPPLESYYLGLANSLLSTRVLGFDGTASTDFEPVYPMFIAAAKLMFGDRHV